MPPADCPVIALSGVLGKKWSFVILDAISFEPEIRFNRLHKALQKASPKILAQRIRQLEQFGLIEKKSARQNGAKQSAFSLTQRGKDIHFALQAFKKWGIAYGQVPAECANTNCAACQLQTGKK